MPHTGAAGPPIAGAGPGWAFTPAQAAGSFAAAAWSSRNRVRSRPRAPAAGSLSWLTPDSASATASAFSGPDARTQTSRAAWMALNVKETRVGGGLGELRTATTEPVAYAAGDSGKIDATWPSGPMPSISTSKAGTAL